MAINFPDTPTTGDTYTVGDKTWKYDGEKWVIFSAIEVTTQQRNNIINQLNMEISP